MAAGGLPANHVRCTFSACAAAAVLQRQAAMPIAPASCIPAPFDPCTCLLGRPWPAILHAVAPALALIDTNAPILSSSQQIHHHVWMHAF